MQVRRPLVGVVADIRIIDGLSYHLAGEKYMAALARGSGVLPVILPPLETAEGAPDEARFYDVDGLLERLDGLFLPGSESDMEPWRYGGSPDPDDASLRDPQRDATSAVLIDAAIARALPLFCVCRGFQELNVALGGTLHQQLHLAPGRADHRADRNAPKPVRYGRSHEVRFAEGSLMWMLAGGPAAMVNSVHGQGIDRLAERLIPEGWAEDGLVEAARVKDAPGFALGVQWHPEWRFSKDALSLALFKAFGEAARDHARAVSRAAAGTDR